MIKQMSPEEKAIALFACKQVSDKLEPEIKKALLEGTIEKFEFIYNGTPTIITISRGKETLKEVENKVIDYDKAIAFAKEHNFEIPMTPPIPPQIDKIKLENMT
ncbi:MAG: hypothetical protein MJ224_00255 [archaeon]|nr:hypothetical protein [archaeon]